MARKKSASGPPTLRAVAEKAGVSAGTASQALSGTVAVSDSARERVLAAANELGYVVNGLARALRTRSSLMLGMVVPESTNPFFADLMGAIEETCRKQGLAVLFGTSANDSERELQYVREFRERQVDGMLLIGAVDTLQIERLLPPNYPVVAVDRIPSGWSRDSVGVDSRAGCQLAVEHLASLGHRRLAFVGGRRDAATATIRREQFLDSSAALGISVAAASEGEFTLASGMQQAEALLNDPAGSLEHRPTAIVAANDLLALGAVSAARQAGLRIPNDLSIVGFDDASLLGVFEPELTTIRQPVEAIAADSISAALARLEAPERPTVMKSLSPNLIVRQTTAPPP